MTGWLAVFKRELAGYFATPVAYIFIVVFLVLTGVFTFAEEFGNWYQRGQADLYPFFMFHPWLYLFLIPALSMRLWAEERKQGTIELLMTLPITLPQAVLGKFLAAWLFAGIALAGTFPMWITVNYLGEPDNGTIVGYDFLLGNRRAWIQPKGTGPLIDLKTYIQTHGGSVPSGVTLEVCSAISNDGKIIVGHGFLSGAWRVVITPDPCPGDATGEGLIDLDDLLLVLGNFGASCEA